MQNEYTACVVDDQEYEFYMMPPGKALRIFTQLAKRALGPVGGALPEGVVGLAGLLQAKVSLDGLLSKLAENLDENWVEITIKQILEHVRRKGGAQIVFEVEFVGRLMHLFKVIAKALEVNYKDFWDGLRDLIASAPRPASEA